jgi:hypothetical protein
MDIAHSLEVEATLEAKGRHTGSIEVQVIYHSQAAALLSMAYLAA